MSCWVCDKANGTCEHADGNVLTPELALEIERRDHADEMAEAKDEIKRLKAELQITERKLKTSNNDAIQCGELAAKRFERIKELEAELRPICTGLIPAWNELRHHLGLSI